MKPSNCLATAATADRADLQRAGRRVAGLRDSASAEQMVPKIAEKSPLRQLVRGVALGLKYLASAGSTDHAPHGVESSARVPPAAVNMGECRTCSTSRVVRPSRRAAAFCQRCLRLSALPARPASGTLNIAYNVNLPSFDPEIGPSSVNPTIQAIYRSVFDQYIGQKPNLAFEPGLLTGWGWNDDKSKVWMDVRENVVWHDGTPVHARRRGLVDPARRQAGRRQSGRVHLGRHRQLQDRRQAHHRAM